MNYWVGIADIEIYATCKPCAPSQDKSYETIYLSHFDSCALSTPNLARKNGACRTPMDPIPDTSNSALIRVFFPMNATNANDPSTWPSHLNHPSSLKEHQIHKFPSSASTSLPPLQPTKSCIQKAAKAPFLPHPQVAYADGLVEYLESKPRSIFRSFFTWAGKRVQVANRHIVNVLDVLKLYHDFSYHSLYKNRNPPSSTPNPDSDDNRKNQSLHGAPSSPATPPHTSSTNQNSSSIGKTNNANGPIQRSKVLIFSHGLIGSRSMYSSFIQGLVSRYNYIVISVEHREGSACASFLLTPPSSDTHESSQQSSNEHTQTLRHTNGSLYVPLESVEHLPENEKFIIRQRQLQQRRDEIHLALNALLHATTTVDDTSVEHSEPDVSVSSPASSTMTKSDCPNIMIKQGHVRQVITYLSSIIDWNHNNLPILGHSFGACTAIYMGCNPIE